MNALTKQRPSKLALFQEILLDMDTENKKLAEMQQRLAGRGMVVSTMAISKFLTSRRRRRWEAQPLDKFAGGGHATTASKIRAEPNLDTLIQLSRLLVFEHATKVMTSLESARQSTQITKRSWPGHHSNHPVLSLDQPPLTLAKPSIQKFPVSPNVKNKPFAENALPGWDICPLPGPRFPQKKFAQ